MSKEGKRSFTERLKRWFKSEHENVPSNHHIILMEELMADLGVDSPTSIRIKSIRELTELMTTRKLEENGIEKVWELVQDLLTLNSASEQRQITLQMLTTLTTAHKDLGLMRLVFFNYISSNYRQQEIKPIFDFFSGVIAGGKNLEYIEEFAGIFLLEWLPAILASPQTVDALHVVINLVKFNSAFLDEVVIMGYIKHVVTLLHHAKSEEEAVLCLSTIESVIAYSSLPSCTLDSVIIALARTVNVPLLTVTTCKIMYNLVGTHVGHTGVCVLCRLIEKVVDPQIVRGAIFFLTSVLWGSNEVSSLNCTPSAVLPTLCKASQHKNVLVVYEIALSMQKLVKEKSIRLNLPSWNFVFEILTNTFKHTFFLEDGIEKSTILTVLMDIIDIIEQLVEEMKFKGSLEKFYSLVDLYSHLRPEDSVVKLIDYQATIINPVYSHWLINLGALLSHHYCFDARPSIKKKALSILSNVYNHNRQIYGRDIVETVIMIQLKGVEKEADVGVRTAAVNLLVQIAITQTSDVVLDILGILEKIVSAPYKENRKPLVRENEATDIVAAVDGLIKVYKVKMFELPSSYAIDAYRILLSCLENHYCKQMILERITKIRCLILEMILEMRVNSKYQIGFPGLYDKVGRVDKDLLPFLTRPYSPYLTVDHKPAQREEQQKVAALPRFSHTRINSLLTKERSNELLRVNEEIVKENTKATALSKTELLPPKYEVTSVCLTETAKIIINSLNKEKDWSVLCFILENLPQALQNKTVVFSQGNTDTFLASALCALVADHSLDLPDSLYNAPAEFTRSSFQSYVYPVLAMLASHHLHLEFVIQQKVIRCLQMGVINRYAGPLCISALTLCVLEMQDSMVKQLDGIILHFSKISATVQNSQAMMEFLSTLLHFPRVYTNFVSEQYKSIFAIAIPYTNLVKFNHYIVSLAYRVIAMWFLKCRLSFRKGFVHFISKNLDMVLKNMSEALKLKHLNQKETEKTGKDQDKENMEQFYSDLKETCVELMARYTFASCAPLSRRDAVAEMIVSGGQSATWLIGNKLITITTSGCSQRPLRNGLCNRCHQLCNIKKKGSKVESSAGNEVFKSIPLCPLSEASSNQPFSISSPLQKHSKSSALVFSEKSSSHSGFETFPRCFDSEPCQSHSSFEPCLYHFRYKSSTNYSISESSPWYCVSEPSPDRSVSGPSPRHYISEPSSGLSVLEPSQSQSVFESSDCSESKLSPSHAVSEPSSGHSLFEPSPSCSVSVPSPLHSVLEPSPHHTVSDSSYNHSLSEPSPYHSVTEPSYCYSVSEPLPSHSVSEPSQGYSMSVPSFRHFVSEPFPSHSVSEPSLSHSFSNQPISCCGFDPSQSHSLPLLSPGHSEFVPISSSLSMQPQSHFVSMKNTNNKASEVSPDHSETSQGHSGTELSEPPLDYLVSHPSPRSLSFIPLPTSQVSCQLPSWPGSDPSHNQQVADPSPTLPASNPLPLHSVCKSFPSCYTNYGGKSKLLSKDDLNPEPVWKERKNNPNANIGEDNFSSSKRSKEHVKEELSPSVSHPAVSCCGKYVGRSSIKNSCTKPHLCGCWCQGWAEIFIRQSTGNISWTMRIQNQQMITEGEQPLHNLGGQYAPQAFQGQNESFISFDSRDDDKNEKNGSRSSLSAATIVSSSPCAGTGGTLIIGSMDSEPKLRNRVHTISDMNPVSRKKHDEGAKRPAIDKKTKGGISPSFVFLQLYYQGQLVNDDSCPLLLPNDNVEIQRALRVIDFIKPQETHKIGILYVGKGQTTEQQILRNTFGSLRYMIFLQGLGSVVELRTVSQDVFLGGLDTNGIDGQITYIWHDDMMQVVFHVATLMPTKDSDVNCTGKKRHIGNNYVTIVYNESDHPYDISTIKGQFNHTVVEVVPKEHSINSVGVLCRPELKEFVADPTPRLVSDDNLPILVRQLALHADLASVVSDSLNRLPYNPYAGNWTERLRKIRKLREVLLRDLHDKSKGQKHKKLLDFTDLTNVTVRTNRFQSKGH